MLLTKGGFFMKQIRKFVILTGIFCFILNACGHSDPKPRANAYDRDGLLGTTGANPNIPTNTGYHTYTMDTKQVKMALQQIKGIQSSRIIFAGPNINIKLDLPKETDIETAMQIKHAAQDAVSQMMPRYKVNVTVGKNTLLGSG
jgi:hypothetical protein